MDDLAVVDVELLEERVVQVPAYLAVPVQVELMDVGDEPESITQHSCTERELIGCGREASFHTGAGDLDLVELGANLYCWQCAISGEVDESGFFVVKLVRSTAERGVRFPLAALRIGERVIQLLLTLGDELFAGLKSDVVVNDRLLDSCDGDVWQVADSILSCSAEEVPVTLATPLGFCVDEP
ncbi:hypothetical protein [Mycolicibacterium agri]|uniref:hypothetical protein n=1 Tax=Mycolicibacterium agri TaxID=36811 RepID=UPI0030778962